MYLVFFGANRELVREAATRHIDEHLPKGATLTNLNSEDYQPSMIDNLLGATSLFGGEEWFVFDEPSSNKILEDEIKDSLDLLKESANTFIILEGPLLAPSKKFYTKHAEQIEEFKTEATKTFNAFSLAEALAQKDKRKLWVLLQEAKLSGLRDEEIIGILWWQLKTIRLAKQTSSASEAGVKDFPYNKAKTALRKFEGDQIEELAESLLHLYHQSHAGLRELDLSLEEWVLKV